MSKIHRVLLVEDSPIAQACAISLLESLGCHVSLAENGRSAIDIAGADLFDLILMDLGLPDVDVLTVTETIQENNKNLNRITPPIIAITAYHDKNIEARCYEAGMQEFMMKPLTLSKAQSILERYT
jgi:CheY-like chemotaxis protein